MAGFAAVLLMFRNELPNVTPLFSLPFVDSDVPAAFKTLLIGITLEALPFLLLGVVVSSLLQVYVPEQTLQRIVPKHPVAAVAAAAAVGLVLPFCECGMIPIVRRLIRKGVPPYVGVVFILAGPIVNPIVFAATYLAFRTRPEIAYSRLALAFAVACAVGLLISRLYRGNPLRNRAADLQSHSHSDPHGKLTAALDHASGEMFEMGKYLIAGAAITAAVQAIVPQSSLAAIGSGEWSSHLFMMGFAYVLSLCSTADAFVAVSFLPTFPVGSLLTFLVFGPMLDLKSTIMLLSSFKWRFVLLLTGCVAALVLAASLLYEQLGMP
ncbi:MAG: permease [Paenibacillaceae bacterium]|nr:permease [Paenibacillaceae bacterium]